MPVQHACLDRQTKSKGQASEWVSDRVGDAVRIPQAVCLHEEDAGILWKHMDYRTAAAAALVCSCLFGHAEVRRSRCMVLSFISTVVNYEYAFYWYFYQNHQHMYCGRLDMAVDDDEGGKGLCVLEMHVEAMPEGKENPYGNGFGTYWKINNPASRHASTGKAVAYKLVPQISPTLIAKPYSLIARRGRFVASKHLWATKCSGKEVTYLHSQHDKLSDAGHDVKRRDMANLSAMISSLTVISTTTLQKLKGQANKKPEVEVPLPQALAVSWESPIWAQVTSSSIQLSQADRGQKKGLQSLFGDLLPTAPVSSVSSAPVNMPFVFHDVHTNALKQ
ncbi:hypothetical protein WJX77_007633 [Trebouxia sp. C0004]